MDCKLFGEDAMSDADDFEFAMLQERRRAEL
jgi:hypothetical protein